MPATKVTQYETTDWTDLSTAPNTVTANGNRSYSLVFNSTDYTGLIQPGTRVRTTRTVAAPTQCTSLNGTNQYFNKTSPAGMTFTDDFVVSAWVRLTSYAAQAVIVSRYNGTSGWRLNTETTGQVTLAGFNGGSGNYSFVQSYQSIPLNKWVHVTAQLDMSSFTATTTTSYVMIDGVDVPAFVSRAGTNPTALVQAGNLEIGSQNGGTLPFPGKLSQVAIYSAKVTQANVVATISQGLAGTETSLISAYSFNNSINDLNTTNANNLTANGSAVATNADSPFGGNSFGNISSTLDYGIVQSSTFSTNTTLVVQVPEGCTIPTSGGVTTVSYSGLKAPYGMPVNSNKWIIQMLQFATRTQGSPVANTWYNIFNQLYIPIGQWSVGYKCTLYSDRAAAGDVDSQITLSTANNSQSDAITTTTNRAGGGTIITNSLTLANYLISLSSGTTYYGNAATRVASGTNLIVSALGDSIYAIPSNL